MGIHSASPCTGLVSKGLPGLGGQWLWSSEVLPAWLQASRRLGAPAGLWGDTLVGPSGLHSLPPTPPVCDVGELHFLSAKEQKPPGPSVSGPSVAVSRVADLVPGEIKSKRGYGNVAEGSSVLGPPVLLGGGSPPAAPLGPRRSGQRAVSGSAWFALVGAPHTHRVSTS